MDLEEEKAREGAEEMRAAVEAAMVVVESSATQVSDE